ncbi:TPA: hypothetical protein ACGD7M_002963 [Serratia marcescens]
MSTEKLCELSKPVVWEISNPGEGTYFIEHEPQAGDYRRDLIISQLYSQEYVSALTQRIADLEAIRSDASQVFKEIGNELGCNPDNESIMVAIDYLKATQMTGTLKDVLKRNIELEAKLATPVWLPETYSPDPWMGPDPSGTWLEKEDVKESIRSAGFTVEGDE